MSGRRGRSRSRSPQRHSNYSASRSPERGGGERQGHNRSAGNLGLRGGSEVRRGDERRGGAVRGERGGLSIPNGTCPIPVRTPLLRLEANGFKYPSRPSLGTKGRAIVVWTNHFQVQLDPGQEELYQYEVAISTKGIKLSSWIAAERKEVCAAVLTTLLKKLKADHPTVTAVSDSRRSIFTSSQLPFKEHKYTLYVDQDESEWDIFVKAVGAGAIPLDQITEFYEGRLNRTPMDAIMALDIALRASATSRFDLFGRNFFSTENMVGLGDGATLKHGYHQSLRPTQAGLTLNVNTVAAMFIKKTTLIDFIAEVAFGGRSFNIEDANAIQAATACVKGIQFRVTHRKHIQPYIARGLTATPPDATFFAKKDGVQMSVAAYFAEAFPDIVIRHPMWPCVEAGAKSKPSYLPLELCVTTGSQRVRKESPAQVAAMIKHTCTTPEDRRRKIEAHVTNAHEHCKYSEGFGLIVTTSPMLAVAARQLPDPELVYASQTIERPRNGAWNLRGKGFYEGKALDSFAIISLGDKRDERSIEQFFGKLVNQLRELKMRGPRGPLPKVLTRLRTQSVEDLFAEAIKFAKKTFGAPPRLVFCVNGTGDSANYAALKRASDVAFGIPSQCMLFKHVGKANPQYIANLLMKVNMKLGGRNVICRGDLPIVSGRSTIVFGCNVASPVSTDKSKPSIASVVASMDRFASHHAACMRKQGHDVKHIEDLEAMVLELLAEFTIIHGMKPKNMLIFRSGISDGEFDGILKKEKRAFDRACEAFDCPASITYVVVTKRHHSRIFPTAAADADRSGNCKSGTVVDTGICHPTEHDFYLMSHSGLQGCSRPAHYHVLHDDMQLDPDTLQLLAYHLCHTFARCTRAVSMVPACYYAHLVAERARLFLVDDGDDGGSIVDGKFVPSTGTLLNVHRDLAHRMYFI